MQLNRGFPWLMKPALLPKSASTRPSGCGGFHPCKTRSLAGAIPVIVMISLSAVFLQNLDASALFGWSERGIHEIAGTDFSVFSLHPPYSTIRAQFVTAGLLV